MPPVFNRYDLDPHPYDDALQVWLGSLDDTRQAMARNVMHDHRVAEMRAEAFDRFVEHPCTSSSLDEAMIDYFHDRVRTRKLPDYVYKKLNENNLIISRGLYPLIPKYVPLVRALDLNGLGLVCQWANEAAHRKKQWKSTLSKLPVSITDASIAGWLDGELKGASSPKVERIVSDLLDIMYTFGQKQPYQPTWATSWAAFEPYKDDGPDRWLEVLGVSAPSPRWVILLKYTVAEAGTLARPTILDARGNGYHFPSPPTAPLAYGGHPVDLRIMPRATDLLPEYIHKQIRHTMAHWTDAGAKIELTGTPGHTTLEDQRRAHHELLVKTYGSDVAVWMSNPF